MLTALKTSAPSDSYLSFNCTKQITMAFQLILSANDSYGVKSWFFFTRRYIGRATCLSTSLTILGSFGHLDISIS